MNTRSFLKTILTASLAPSLLLARAGDAYRWKQEPTTKIWIVNPEWENATLEIGYIAREELHIPGLPIRIDERNRIIPHLVERRIKVSDLNNYISLPVLTPVLT
jgi:hypothetical protein